MKGARYGGVSFNDAAILVIERGAASAVILQRRLDIGYSTALELLGDLERYGIVGPLIPDIGRRAILVTMEEYEKMPFSDE